MDHLPCRHGSETRRPAHGQRERRRAIGNCHFDREQPTNTQQGNKSTTGQKGRGFPVRGEPCIHCGARRRPRPPSQNEQGVALVVVRNTHPGAAGGWAAPSGSLRGCSVAAVCGEQKLQKARQAPGA